MRLFCLSALLFILIMTVRGEPSGEISSNETASVVCHRPPPKGLLGFCKRIVFRYTYNKRTENCVSFTDCSHSENSFLTFEENSFLTFEECRRDCMKNKIY